MTGSPEPSARELESTRLKLVHGSRTGLAPGRFTGSGQVGFGPNSKACRLGLAFIIYFFKIF